jgi:radical SAM protein (TIGR01212 family)
VNKEATYKWGTARRFNSYADWFTGLFGGRVQKLSINAGFTCPNRDGTLGYGGCTYCNNEAFIPGYCTPDKSVTEQIEQGIAFHRRRYRRAERYIAYFQAYTNTYAGIDRLTALYDEALNHPGVTGLVIGTRPDCITGELLDHLAVMAREYFIMIEYGIESVSDDTLRRINRGHDFATAIRALEETAARGLSAGAHSFSGCRARAAAPSLTVRRSYIIASYIAQDQAAAAGEGTAMAREYVQNPARSTFIRSTSILTW